MIWRVHGDVTAMMAGGVAALLLQMLHPKALGGVWDHSEVQSDMLGRLRRTARFIAVTTYGERGSAEAAIGKVRAIHAQVAGELADGTAYRADDPHLLAWVHVAGALMFLDGWRRYGEPRMSVADQDRYFAEAGDVARMLGADPAPSTRREAERLIAEFQPELHSDARTRAFCNLILWAPSSSLAKKPVQQLLMRASVDLLPPFARELHGLRPGLIPAPMIRGAIMGMAGTLPWAFAAESYR